MIIRSKRSSVKKFDYFLDFIFQSILFSLWLSLLVGLMRLVRLALRACRIFVRCLVVFIRCACAISGAAEQSATAGTVLPFLSPVSQRHFILTPPLGSLLKTILCSVMNSQARILAYDESIASSACDLRG
jgi:hypothetical protein